MSGEAAKEGELTAERAQELAALAEAQMESKNNELDVAMGEEKYELCDTLSAESEALVTLREGKFHQIKRMLAARKAPVLYLKRLSMGPLRLDPALARGEWRYLTDLEVRALCSLKAAAKV